MNSSHLKKRLTLELVLTQVILVNYERRQLIKLATGSKRDRRTIELKISGAKRLHGGFVLGIVLDSHWLS